MGFAKAFHYAKIDPLTQDISKPMGILWLVTALLFLVVLFLFAFHTPWWWIPGIVAIASQFLIILSWQDAKFGTLANLIILAAILWGFKK